jgi:hypothetical protein
MLLLLLRAPPSQITGLTPQVTGSGPYSAQMTGGMPYTHQVRMGTTVSIEVAASFTRGCSAVKYMPAILEGLPSVQRVIFKAWSLFETGS